MDSPYFLVGAVRGQNSCLTWRPMIGGNPLLLTCDPIWSFRQRCSFARTSELLSNGDDVSCDAPSHHSCARPGRIDRPTVLLFRFVFILSTAAFCFVSVQLSRSFCIPLRFSRSLGCPIGARNEVFSRSSLSSS